MFSDLEVFGKLKVIRFYLGGGIPLYVGYRDAWVFVCLLTVLVTPLH